MRNKIKVSLLFLAVGQCAQANNAFDPNSHTFLTVRPEFQMASPERVAGFRDRALARECGFGGAFQIVPFGGRSVQSKDIGEYFAFNNKNTLIVAEDAAPGATVDAGGIGATPNFRDINAIHFNIQSVTRNFKSEITFKPRRTVAGVGLEWRQYLHGRDACDKKWWLDISTPITYVRTNMNLSEKITTTQNPIQFLTVNGVVATNTSMEQAFKGLKGLVRQDVSGTAPAATLTGSAWQFGKIDGSRKTTRAGDIEIRLGYDYGCTECWHAEGYIGGVIPAGNRPKYEYVFEPIVGHNFHGGLQWGAAVGWELWSSCDRYLHMELATNGRYSFQNKQTRAIDVTGKSWSRYMAVYRSYADAASQAAQDGINVFTRKVKVDPRYQKDINSALVYTSGGFQGELGYNFWARATEKVSLNEPFETGITFADVGDYSSLVNGVASVLPAFVAGTVNRAVTIKENFALAGTLVANASAYNLLALTEDDLNFYSAATPAAITNTFYASLGYRWDNLCYPVALNVGGSYEVASERSALSRWLVWGKLALSI